MAGGSGGGGVGVGRSSGRLVLFFTVLFTCNFLIY